jgi:general secretion pathway protein J
MMRASRGAAATACARPRRGFTLLELLVALTILALLSVLGYRAVVALTDGETRLTEETRRWRALDALFSRLEADLREAIPRDVRSAGGTESAWFGATDADGNALLVFSRAGPEFTPDVGSAGQRLGYRLNHGAVEVLYWPWLDNASGAEPAAYALEDDIAGFRIEYLDRSGASRDRWPVAGEASLPRAVHVVLTLAGGETVERWLALR